MRQPGTSLTPYGMSFWALILAACGGGGGGGGGGLDTAGPSTPVKSEPRSGHVYDGSVKGAVVYVDSDDDDELNTEKDHRVGTTNEQGTFSGSIPVNLVGKRYIVDLRSATDLGDDGREGAADDQDLSGFGIWLAPQGASVVSALTHLIATGVMTKNDIQSTIPGFDPLVDNPYAPAPAGQSPEKQRVFEKIRKVLPTITNLVEKNRDVIKRKSESGETPQLSEDESKILSELENNIKQVMANPDAQHAPVLALFGTVVVNEGTVTGETDTGLRVRVTDVNSGETGYKEPDVVLSGDNRFKIENGKIFTRAGVSFRLGEPPITLTLTATDGNDTDLTDTDKITFTVSDVQHAPEPEIRGRAAVNDGTLTSDADTGLTVSATDNDSAETGYVAPRFTLLGDNRFKIVDNNKIVAIDGASFTSGEEITLTLTATDGNNASLTGTDEITFTVLDDRQPPTLTITPPADGQTRVNETVGDGVTGRIDTGIAVVARDPENNLGPLEIKSRQGESWVLDNRFEVSGDKLIVKAGQTFNFEDLNNPEGVITLQITARDIVGNRVEKEVTVQLANVNELVTDKLFIVFNGEKAKGPLKEGVTLDFNRRGDGIVDVEDPDGTSSRNTYWYKQRADGTWQEVEGILSRAYENVPAGIYRLKTIVTDSVFGTTSTVYSDPITVEEAIHFKVVKGVSQITEAATGAPLNAGYDIHIAKILLPDNQVDFLSDGFLKRNLYESTSNQFTFGEPRFKLKFVESDTEYHKFTLFMAGYMRFGESNILFDGPKRNERGDQIRTPTLELVTLNGVIDVTLSIKDKNGTSRVVDAKTTTKLKVVIYRPTEGEIA